MKLKFVFAIIMVLGTMYFTSCDGESAGASWQTQGYATYEDFVAADLNKLTPPVIMIGKGESSGRFSITVKDANDTIRTYGNLSTTAHSIGSVRKVGDTIK